MKFGLSGGAHATHSDGSDSRHYQDFVDFVCEADRLGYHSSFIVEHHFTGIGQVSATLSLLTYLAAKTQNIRLGTAVTVLPWHNPVLLAEQVATLDLLSDGRADIGVGKGYRPGEFKGFCIDQTEATDRYEEGLEILLKALTSTERFTHSGKYWQFEDIIVEPRPVQSPRPPIWVGAASAGSIQKAAGNGFKLLLDHWASIETIKERLAIYREGLGKAGRSSMPEQVAVLRWPEICRNEAERVEAIRKRAYLLIKSGILSSGTLNIQPRDGESEEDMAYRVSEEGIFAGTPEQIIEELHGLEDAGVDYVLLVDANMDRQDLRNFADQVMPAFAPETAKLQLVSD